MIESPRYGTMKTDVQQAGTLNKIKKGQRVRLFPTTNLPQKADELKWFAEPLESETDGQSPNRFSMTIFHDDVEVDMEYGDI